VLSSSSTCKSRAFPAKSWQLIMVIIGVKYHVKGLGQSLASLTTECLAAARKDTLNLVQRAGDMQISQRRSTAVDGLHVGEGATRYASFLMKLWLGMPSNNLLFSRWRTTLGNKSYWFPCSTQSDMYRYWAFLFCTIHRSQNAQQSAPSTSLVAALLEPVPCRALCQPGS
jgi:hypothetical protein